MAVTQETLRTYLRLPPDSDEDLSGFIRAAKSKACRGLMSNETSYIDKRIGDAISPSGVSVEKASRNPGE